MFYFNLILLYVIITHCHRSVRSISTLRSTNTKVVNEETDNVDNRISLMELENDNKINVKQIDEPLVRVKKSNDGASKFTQAANMNQLKVLRVFLQLFKNSWDGAYVGGSHPLHPNVPKAVVGLYKLRIVDFFFPQIGEDPRKSGK